MAAAVRLRAVPSLGTGKALRPWKPVSLTFSAPTTITVS